MGIETLIGGAISLIGGSSAKKSASKAVDAQVAAADRATALQEKQLDQTRADQEPWRRGGENALYSLLTKTGVGGNVTGRDFGDLSRGFDMQKDYQEDPGYQFRLGQGMQGIQRGAAAAGSLGSGKYLKDLVRFNQGEASNEFGNSWNRWNTGQNQQFNRLASISGLGQTANSQISQAGQNYANQAGQNITGAGNARASGYVGGANAMTNALGQGMGFYQNQQLLNQFGGVGGMPGWGNGGGWQGGGRVVPDYPGAEY